MTTDRPPGIFDREVEWDDLVQFATGPPEQFRIGIVHGRRRQGKSFLLRAIAHQVGGFYHQALEEERAPALERIGATLAAQVGLAGVPITPPDWAAAIRAVAGGQQGGQFVVLDEFPYLAAKSPELPSAIQAAFDAAAAGQHPPFRLLLCGSAVSVMARLLSGQQALRGRAVLDLVVRPFGYRDAAAFWGLGDPSLAFLVHSVIGGTPGYRDLLGAPPRSSRAFGDWLVEGVLNPSHAMFHEADYLLSEEPTLTDRSLYQSALAAIAAGHSAAGAVAAALGRPVTSITHVLDGLERAGFIERLDDALRQRRPVLRVADPFLRFHHAVMRPELARFEARLGESTWLASEQRFRSSVLGPHLKDLARTWVADHASQATVGGRAVRVGPTQIADPAGRSRIELDVVAISDRPGHRRAVERPRVLLIGEAEASTRRLGVSELGRLERARVLLGTRADAAGARLALFSAAGFDRELTADARRRDDVVLVDLERLYGGD